MKNKIIKDTLKNEGRKLGYLLSESSLPEKLKLEIVNLIDKMSAKQIKKLIDILEAKYLDVNTSDIDNKYINKSE